MNDQFRIKQNQVALYLDIKPLHHHGLNCIEDSAISILSWMNKQYAIVFADSWGFEFKNAPGTDDNLLGDKIGPGSSAVLSNIKDYFGLEYEFREFGSPGEVMPVLRSELKNGLPVLIYVDGYWCPWFNQYRKLHQHHYCLAIGLDADSNIYCLDSTLNAVVSLLPYDHFLKSSDKCTTFSISGSPKEIDCYEKLNAAVTRLFDKHCFAGIRKFADIFREKFDFAEEFRNFETSVWNVLFYRNIGFIAGARMLFAVFLKFLYTQLNDEKFLKYSDDLVWLSSKWNVINGILLKSYHTSFNQEKKQTVAELFEKIAGWEEQIAAELLHPEKNGFQGARQKPAGFNYPTTAPGDNTIFLDLRKYCNNKGFAHDMYNETAADFTGTGLFFLTRGLPENSIWTVKTMQFRFPEIIPGNMDNIACRLQEIDSFPQCVYDSIQFLGNAEYGNYYEELQIQYTDNKAEAISIQFTDWMYPPVFGEAVAWEGCVAERRTDAVDIINGYKMRIFAVEYLLKEKTPLKKIILPDCPNIHIFAISLRTSQQC